MKKTIDWKKLLVKNSKYILLVVMVIVSALVSDKFFTSTNISNLFKQNAAVGIVALGELVVILTGHRLVRWRYRLDDDGHRFLDAKGGNADPHSHWGHADRGSAGRFCQRHTDHPLQNHSLYRHFGDPQRL